MPRSKPFASIWKSTCISGCWKPVKSRWVLSTRRHFLWSIILRSTRRWKQAGGGGVDVRASPSGLQRGTWTDACINFKFSQLFSYVALQSMLLCNQRSTFKTLPIYPLLTPSTDPFRGHSQISRFLHTISISQDRSSCLSCRICQSINENTMLFLLFGIWCSIHFLAATHFVIGVIAIFVWLQAQSCR